VASWNQSAINTTLSILISEFLWLLNTETEIFVDVSFICFPSFCSFFGFRDYLSQLPTIRVYLDRNSGSYWIGISLGLWGLNLLPCCNNKFTVAPCSKFFTLVHSNAAVCVEYLGLVLPKS